ncbi:MAG TPA: GntR family transcriptional regulator, partial [Nocardioides sp.]|nr:GntR family transcriptional regulator [Nocardioides sp.]
MFGAARRGQEKGPGKRIRILGTPCSAYPYCAAHSRPWGDLVKTNALKHVAIREYVRALVADSAPGAAAPSERDLVDRFGVARMTVRHAL